MAQRRHPPAPALASALAAAAGAGPCPGSAITSGGSVLSIRGPLLIHSGHGAAEKVGGCQREPAAGDGSVLL